MAELDLEEARAAIRRLLTIAKSNTGQSRRVANFLLAWWNATDCGGFDFTDLWMLDRNIGDDIVTVVRLIAARQEYPNAYGFGKQFERLVVSWRPQLVGEEPRKA